MATRDATALQLDDTWSYVAANDTSLTLRKGHHYLVLEQDGDGARGTLLTSDGRKVLGTTTATLNSMRAYYTPSRILRRWAEGLLKDLRGGL